MIDITHVHPMLVHFPIVLFLLAVAIQVYIVATGGDLAAPECLPRTACIALVLGTVAAAAAAVFGDIALDHAVDLGFAKGELEEHEELGFATLWIFVALSVLHLGARWKDVALEGTKGWVMAAAGIAGVVVLIVAAAHGGELVYEMGVNVKGVVPVP